VLLTTLMVTLIAVGCGLVVLGVAALMERI
jgi:hypothetical protein